MKPLWAASESTPAPDRRIASPVPGVSVSTPWGRKPKNNTYWQARGHHTGDDYACSTGTPVVAVLPGKIKLITDRVLGLVTLLYADNGKTYWYCHLSRRRFSNSRPVEAGEVLGYAGMTGTGASMGPHLHFEMRDGHTTSWAGPDRKPTW